MSIPRSMARLLYQSISFLGGDRFEFADDIPESRCRGRPCVCPFWRIAYGFLGTHKGHPYNGNDDVNMIWHDDIFDQFDIGKPLG